ncbi:SPOSA6832_00045, partial [Sporobolomyces salmonicolor]
MAKPSTMDVDSPPKPQPGKTKRKAGNQSDSDDEREGSDVEVSSPPLRSFVKPGQHCEHTLHRRTDPKLAPLLMLDVSFSFFDPQPQDYHSIKLLLSQLLQGDAQALDLGGVTDVVLEQKLVGSTVKTDGGEGDDKASEGDPYAVLTVLNLNIHKDHPPISSLVAYLVSKLPPSSPFRTELESLLAIPVADSSAATPRHVGLVLNERLVNMPVQVVPPMFRMLEEELQWAREDASLAFPFLLPSLSMQHLLTLKGVRPRGRSQNEPYHFSHLLFLSRVFRSSSSSFDEDPNAALEASAPSQDGKKKGGKKKKKTGQHVGQKDKDEELTWMYHAEDEWIQKFAAHQHVFAYTHSKRSDEASSGEDQFGVDTRGQMMLVPWDRFGEMVEGLEGFVGGSA